MLDKSTMRPLGLRTLGVIVLSCLACVAGCSNPERESSTTPGSGDIGIPRCDGTQGADDPCWNEHDGEDPRRVDTRTSSAPLSTILVHHRFGDQAMAHLSATSYLDVGGRELAREETRVRSSLEPPNVAIGTCGAITRPPPPSTDALEAVNRGNLRLIAGGTHVVGGVDTMGIRVGHAWSYEADYVHADVAAAPEWDLSFSGCGYFRAFDIRNATGPIPIVRVTAPNVGGDGATISSGPLTIEWDETSARRMVISLSDFACAVDPAARSFTIPKEVVGAPGDKTLQIDVGEIRRLPIVPLGEAMLTMQLHTQSFVLHVQ